MDEIHGIIDSHLQEATKMLVAFDIDMTLTVPSHPACYYPNLLRYKSVLARYLLMKRIISCLSEIEYDQTLTLGTQLPEQQLIEQNTPAFIAWLQQQGIKTIALTASLSGGVPGLPDLKANRFKSLQKLGIDFSQTFAIANGSLLEFPPHNHHYPAYHQGILYANGGKRTSNKGAVLVAFLKKLSWRPTQIVMIDDLPSNLEDISNALADFDSTIQFIGIDYHGGKNYMPEQATKKDMLDYWQAIVKKVRDPSPHTDQ